MSKMEKNGNNYKKVTDSCSDSNCRESLLRQKNADSLLRIDETNREKPVASKDETTDLTKSNEIPFITIWCLIQLVYPILSHVFDFWSDIRLTIDYFASQKTCHGSLTLTFTILQATTAAWISSLIHHPKWEDVSIDDENEKPNGNWFARTAKLIAQYTTVLLFQMAVPMCHLSNFFCAWKLRSAQQRKDEVRQSCYHRKMLEEDINLAVLRVTECFIQSAPQLILQVFFLLTQETAINVPIWEKIVSGALTLINLGSAMKSYHCAVRLAQPDKAQISKIGRVFLQIWHSGTIGARILVIGIATSNWPLLALVACFIHWICCAAWIYATANGVSILKRNKLTSSDVPPSVTERIKNFILSGVVAVVYLYTFVNIGGGLSLVRNSVYHIMCLLEIGTVVILWSIFCDITVDLVWFSRDLVISSVVLFFIGIAAMAMYYMFFHPSMQRGSSVAPCLATVEDK